MHLSWLWPLPCLWFIQVLPFFSKLILAPHYFTNMIPREYKVEKIKYISLCTLQKTAQALQSRDGIQIIPDFNLRDSNDQTVLGLALWTGLHSFAAQLLHAGANINYTTGDGHTLLHLAIQKQDTSSALFLLEHQADINVKWVPYLAYDCS